MAFSPDSSLLACGFGTDHSVIVWDSREWTKVAVLAEGGAIGGSVSFSPDGQFLGTGGYRLRLFRVPAA
jgi:WD40 repeat protein